MSLLGMFLLLRIGMSSTLYNIDFSHILPSL
jgi:hypothetical protein